MRVYLHRDESASELAGQLLASYWRRYPAWMKWSTGYIQMYFLTFGIWHDFLNVIIILAPLNQTTQAINTTLVAKLPGESVEYKSLDSILDES